MKRMLINASHSEEVRIALVDGQKLNDLDIENRSREQKKSSIYKARITRVEPSLEAAFVDFGSERHGFLPLKEIARGYFKKRMSEGGSRTPIQDLVQEGQEVLVQVDKEERGNKGAALTTFISLAGRYMVLMPNNPRAGGISRRIEGDDRDELREALSHLDIPEGMGVIVRTAGVGRSAEELQWDLAYLLQLWQAIQSANEVEKTPSLIYQENSAVLRAIRDNLRRDVGEVLIEGEEAYAEASSFIAQVMPHYKEKVKPYSDGIPLFSRYQIESQIESAFEHTVKLPSGGSIVIDPTEALVSIDINSARATKGADIEETALNTNLEAADEVARQLRIRDIGGLIVIDFIDMVNQKNQRAVENRMRDALEVDRARVQVSRISRFGLMEMSRQRLRPSLEEITTVLCPRCNGQGRIRDTKSLALAILRILEEESLKERSAVVRVQVPLAVGAYLLNEKRQDVAEIEQRTGCHVVIIPNTNLDTPHYIVERLRDDHVKEEGIVPSSTLSELANKANDEDIPDDSVVINRPQAAVQTLQPQQPPPAPVAAPEKPAAAATPAAATATPEASTAKAGFWSKLVKNLFSDDAAPAADERPSAKRKTENRTRTPAKRQDREQPSRGRTSRDQARTTQSKAEQSRPAKSDNNSAGDATKREDNRESNRDRPKRNSRKSDKPENRNKSESKETAEKSRTPKREGPKKPRPSAAERAPSEDALASSKRAPKRDRSESKPATNPSTFKSQGPDRSKSTVEVVSNAVGGTVSAAASHDKAEADFSERKPTKPRGRASNDPRNRNKKSAENNTVSEAARKETQPVEQSRQEQPEVSEPPVLEQPVAAAEAVTEKAPARNRRATPKDPAPQSENDQSAETAEQTSQAEQKTEQKAEQKAEPKAEAETEVAAPEAAAAEQTPAAEPAPARPARAYNDPREIKRRQREAELKKQGVMSNSSGRQDSTDGSSSK
ncbi:MAG: Rne/Rng family ribonuclease [Pseudomonadaceae bacterium]|nr:Rne/Rng family ribonuclease [Pseudomonadaceae bacterium]